MAVNKERVLVTGASGFIGKFVCRYLYDRGYNVVAAVRKYPSVSAPYEFVRISDIIAESEWINILKKVDVVVHLAGKAHLMKAASEEDEQEFLRVNAIGTKILARAAADCGVERFIFVSSIKVNGECTPAGPGGLMEYFSEDNVPNPRDSYAVSKWEAEKTLNSINNNTDMGCVILRVPLVYGPGVKANFLKLLKLVDHGLPLPFGGIKNARSLLYTGNLADAIRACIRSPAAPGNTFLVSDRETVSLPGLIKIIAGAMGRGVLIFYFPVFFLKLLGVLSRRLPQMERLIGSLCVNNSRIISSLSWSPPFSLEEGIKDTVDFYKRKDK